MALAPYSIDAVKGWTRCSVVAFIALAVSEMDVTDKETQDLLLPLHKVLDKSWLLPMHAARFNLVTIVVLYFVSHVFPLVAAMLLVHFKELSFQRNYKYQMRCNFWPNPIFSVFFCHSVTMYVSVPN